jgi:hypothetical protein
MPPRAVGERGAIGEPVGDGEICGGVAPCERVGGTSRVEMLGRSCSDSAPLGRSSWRGSSSAPCANAMGLLGCREALLPAGLLKSGEASIPDGRSLAVAPKLALPWDDEADAIAHCPKYSHRH